MYVCMYVCVCVEWRREVLTISCIKVEAKVPAVTALSIVFVSESTIS